MRRLGQPALELASAPDAELLRGYTAGRPQAFAELYDRYDRQCFQFISRMLGPAHAAAAEDLHQETWVSISRHAAAFDPARASFPAWLFTIARRKVWDFFRRQKVAVLTSGEEEAVLAAPDPGPTPAERLEARELAERLVAAVQALPLVQRETFIMFAQAGLSLEEIAEATGVPTETSKSRLRYARAKLKQVLAGKRSPHV